MSRWPNPEEPEKGKGKEVFEKLSLKKKSVWDFLSDNERAEVFDLARRYRDFLSNKTERAVVGAIERAVWFRFKDVCKDLASSSDKKFYQINREKSIALAVLGEQSLAKGCKIIFSHVDSPRLDLKPNPLCEADGMGLLRTHYYGGIKKYQWVTMPLAIHGVIIKIDGSCVEICIGENIYEPVFTIADILPHLAKDQREQKMFEGVSGENLKVIVGSMPLGGDEVSSKIKFWILSYLNNRYGATEEDFISAELEIVPAGPARDIGFDASMIGGYGQDDRVCVYASLRALLNADAGKIHRPIVAFFLDKEEIGSEGNTGAKAFFVEQFIENLLKRRPVLEDGRHLTAVEVLARSEAISADVTAAVDPGWESAHEMQNAALLGYGVGVEKYTGSGGKYSSSEASAEYVAKIRRIFKKAGVIWQADELGKIDHGGGGTLAIYLAKRGMDVIDIGPPVVSMHSPFEIVSKADIWMAYKAYKAFFESE
jgi:aspartyl aminopeptidase